MKRLKILPALLAFAIVGAFADQGPDQAETLSKGVISIRPGTHSPKDFGFGPNLSVHFSLSAPALVTLHAFAPDGRRVATLFSEELAAGRYSRRLDARSLPEGAYFLRLRSGKLTETAHILLSR